ncbi:SBBP repeat-containing protein [Gloeobacter kilaueensis]|uniref:IPT/TIG domain-containing protein n=1 Tax=Gloeobacter kilaueensis (strain ATCC BAA-2537 / CCAP 1431/1 / ULC 316 / JS1) TaxID=1183438 RepID=U5QNM1_GLOK1|nr:SBBP repeat-containing protein [Gloeobacter kilaueensis]AGY59270.1 hypothetical protein GKIL_3024 [Gloeobacter kilaueensis JS1]
MAKLNKAGKTLVYSTYLGGDSSDFGYDIAVDNLGNAYVSGSTTSNNFPLVNEIYFTLNGFAGFLSILNATGSGLIFSTLLPGNVDFISVALDSTGNAYVSGETVSPSFPITPGAVQATLNGGDDAFITKINPSTPLVTGFSPASGPVGTAITLTGTGFSKTSYVYFTNGKKAPFTIVSDTQLVVTVPTGATTAKIDVYVPFGKAQSPTAFTVTP